MTPLALIPGRSLLTGQPLRDCGGCTACCSVLACASQGKPYHCDCKHLTPGGCAIYDERPADCAEYECFWLAGLGEEQDRPDQIGLLFSIRHDQGSIYIDCHETEPGALLAAGQRFWWLLDHLRLNKWLAKTFRAVCIFPYGVPVAASFPSAPGYPPWRQPGMHLAKMNETIYVYLGAYDEQRRLIYYGQVCTSKEDHQEAYEDALRKIPRPKSA